MTAMDGFRSVLALILSPLSLLSFLSVEGSISCELTVIAFECFVDLIEPRIPVGKGIFAFSDFVEEESVGFGKE